MTDTTSSLNRCPECGYTKEDALIHWDHHLCKGKIPGYEGGAAIRKDAASVPIPSGQHPSPDTLNQKAFEEACKEHCRIADHGLAHPKALKAAIQSYLAALPSEMLGDMKTEYSRGYDVGYLQATQEMLEIQQKRESGWVSTKDRLPAKPGKASYEHVDCLVVYKGEVEQLMWNCEHLVWDDRSGDDFYCNPGEVEYWMPTPNPPEIEVQTTIMDEDRHFQYEGPNQECGKD